MSKGKKAATAVFIIAVAAIIGIIAWVYFSSDSADKTQTESETQTLQVSETESKSETTSSTTAAEQTTEESTTQETTRKDTTVKVDNYNLPLTVKEAMDALQIHYGDKYEINSTVEENGLNYFSVNIDGEKFASVAVDLSTGQAEETIKETGAKAQFSLV